MNDLNWRLNTTDYPNGVPDNLSHAGALLAHYPLRGNANDESGNGNNGTVIGATLTTDRIGVVDQAYSFDGTGSEISIPNNITPAEFTITAWIKTPSAWTIGLQYASIIHNGVFRYFLGHYEGKLRIYTNNTTFRTSSNTMRLNSWYFVIWEHSTAKNTDNLYLNGYLDYTTTKIPDPNTLYATTTIGGYYLNDSYAYTGKINNIRIYNRSLTSAERKALYKSVDLRTYIGFETTQATNFIPTITNTGEILNWQDGLGTQYRANNPTISYTTANKKSVRFGAKDFSGVTSVVLSSLNLGGTVPVGILDLPNIAVFHIDSNNYTGTQLDTFILEVYAKRVALGANSFDLKIETNASGISADSVARIEGTGAYAADGIKDNGCTVTYTAAP